MARTRTQHGKQDSDIVTVRLIITPMNSAPTAHVSIATGAEDTPLVMRWSDFAVLDADGDALTITLTELPAQGALQILRNGAWTGAMAGISFTNADPDAGKLRFIPVAIASGGPGYTVAGNGDQRAQHGRLGYSVFDGHATPVLSHGHIDIAAVADAAQLQLLGDTVQREVFNTGWESARNLDNQSTLVNQGVFEGWSLITGTDTRGTGITGGRDGFEIWTSGDQMTDANDRTRTVSAATGGGSNWLEINDAGGSQYQTLGIARQIATEKGASYSLSFDLAGRLGFGSNTTRIAV